jgi:beta-N-acetylhexosaminidase
MTAHVRVPSLDDAPATLSRAVVSGLLRGELGYDGLVLTDAMEMKAVSGTAGIAGGAVRALNAGVDAVLLGHDLGEATVVEVQTALVDAVTSGDLAEARLVEAAGRVRRVARWAGPRPAAGALDGEVGRTAASRALQSAGDPSLVTPPLVVELRPPVNLAAGDATHSPGAVLAERLQGTETVALDESSSGVADVLSRRGDRGLVVVVRDAHRHGWMREAAAALLAAAPDSVVVDVGIPVWHPGEARGYIATFGGSRVSYEAMTDRLLGAHDANGAVR